MMVQRARMKKNNIFLAIGIATILFAIPFFWLPSGFVNFGGDGGRFYFLQPLSVMISIWQAVDSYSYAIADLPYVGYQYLVSLVIPNVTYRIALEHGLQLSLAFLAIYMISREMIQNEYKRNEIWINTLVSSITGFVYLGLISKVGWSMALVTLNQVFLNVVIFYLLLRLCLTSKFQYMLVILILTIFYSSNFGLGSAPQLFSFYPLSLLFLYIYTHYIVGKKFPWRSFLVGGVLFLGLHSFHLFPVIASLFNTSSEINTQVFNSASIQKSGVEYFAVNHVLGKMSRELFFPWLGQNLFGVVLPLCIVVAFIRSKSRLLFVLGLFFVFTLFLVTANITHIGVWIYQLLFYIPGFTMFRSFSEKWFFVFSFFYMLLVSLSLPVLVQRSKKSIQIILLGILLCISIYRIVPFLKGGGIKTSHFQSTVSTNYSLDPNLLEALEAVRSLPHAGRILTLPLTFPYYQVAYGKEGGAYVGISLVSHLTNRRDFTGFWSLGKFEQLMFDALRENNTKRITQILSLLNIQYIFRNTDPRVMDNFPGYPYVYPGFVYSSKNQIPSIQNQKAYDGLLSRLQVREVYTKGFYTIYELPYEPTGSIYIPEYIASSLERVHASSRLALVDDAICANVYCDRKYDVVPRVSYKNTGPGSYDIVLDTNQTTRPFLLVFSQEYYSPWKLTIGGKSFPHIVVNQYANGWIIDPMRLPHGKVVGHLSLTSRNFIVWGMYVSLGTMVFISMYVFVVLVQRNRHEKI